jgi:hypothetical protein
MDKFANITFLRTRALISRQMGSNMLSCGAETGEWLLIRANRYDLAADEILTLRNKNTELEATIAKLQEKAKK